jgi:hypothetical protein
MDKMLNCSERRSKMISLEEVKDLIGKGKFVFVRESYIDYYYCWSGRYKILYGITGFFEIRISHYSPSTSTSSNITIINMINEDVIFDLQKNKLYQDFHEIKKLIQQTVPDAFKEWFER